MIYRKPAKFEFGKISFKSRAYPNEILVAEKGDRNPTRKTEKSPLKAMLEKIEKNIEQIMVSQMDFTVELFTSEFDQSETKWDLSCKNLVLNVEQSLLGKVNI